jgi:hypothetical protein
VGNRQTLELSAVTHSSMAKTGSNRIQYTFLDGSSYDGEIDVVTGAAHGNGTRTFPEGSRYEGNWKQGVMDGYGVMIFGSNRPTLESYTGNWRNNKFEGDDILRYEYYHVPGVQASYEGSFKAGQKHGKGRQTWFDGESYEGNWEHDKRHGFGEQNWTDGGCYVGEWKADRRDGSGRQSRPRGACYEGEWKDDARHGVGRQTEIEGDCYEGEWRHDKRHGCGIRSWEAGNHYRGGWKYDKRHGIGTQTCNGEYCEGEWEDDKPLGRTQDQVRVQSCYN